MLRTLVVLTTVFGATSALAQDTERYAIGGDQYVAGNNAIITGAVEHDAFAAGFDARISAPVSGDAHAAGFNVTIEGPVGHAVYAAGFSVVVSAAVTEDVSAAGNTVTLLPGGTVGGNARLAGASVTVSAPVEGAAILAAETATVSSVVSGDLSFTGRNLVFTGDARVDGQITIRAPEEIDVPASVAPASRVTFEQIEDWEGAAAPIQAAEKAVKSISPWVIVLPGLIWLAILLIVGLVVFALMPQRSGRVYARTVERPWWTLFLGFLASATLLGLVPVLAMTIIGLPLVPVQVVIIFLASILAHVAGAYVLGGRILDAARSGNNTLGWRMVGLLIGLVIILLLGLVPFVGWLVWLVAAFAGLGGMLRSNEPPPAPTAA